MKKTYVEPNNTVVALRARVNILQTSPITETSGVQDLGYSQEGTGDAGVLFGAARENISVPDPWEEW